MCADKVFVPLYQSDHGEPDEMDCEGSSEEFDFHTKPHDKADVVVALATVPGTHSVSQKIRSIKSVISDNTVHIKSKKKGHRGTNRVHIHNEKQKVLKIC